MSDKKSVVFFFAIHVFYLFIDKVSFFFTVLYFKLFVDKVSEVVTDVGTKTVKVTSSMSSDEVLEVLKKTGIEVSFKG